MWYTPKSSLLKWMMTTTFLVGGAFWGFYFFHTHRPLSLAYVQEGVRSSDEWEISFGQEVRVARARMVPAVSGKWYVKNGLFGASSLKFRPSDGFVKGAEYHADITLVRTYDDAHTIELPRVAFTTERDATPPAIERFEASNPIVPGGVILVVFNVPMATTSSPLIIDVPGSGVWKDPRTYTYTVSRVSGGTTYTVKLPAGARSQGGGRATTDDVRTVASPGPVVATFSNASRELGVRDPIEISFDQLVDHESAQKAFRISPTTKGTFSWQGENLIFTPTRLAHQKTYTVSLAPGIIAQYGLPSKEKVTTFFTTAPEVFKLTVPYFKQAYSRSCEAASLRMALAYLGITTDDMSIIKKAGYDPRPKDKEKNEWDDPHEMFVGDASKDDGEGYGMYREPLAKSAEAFGRNAYAVSATAITPQFLAKNVRAGYPVVVWGYISPAGPKVTWNTPSGGEALALADEHARLVVGVYGSTENPIGFYLHDPLDGKQYEYWDADKLIAHLSAVPGVTDQAVVVK